MIVYMVVIGTSLLIVIDNT